ncbi:hypothetical protein [Bacillus suaedaesalsae]|nr:hypothetical protein [Bacillus suaedaesalsae]
MNNQENNKTTNTSDYVSGYKVVEVNVSNLIDNLYAVVTPVKTK